MALRLTRRESIIAGSLGLLKLACESSPAADLRQETPVFSCKPDLRDIIIFQSQSIDLLEKDQRIKSIKPDGSEEKDLVNDGAMNIVVGLTNDGCGIAYLTRDSQRTALNIMNSDGSFRREVADLRRGETAGIDFSPNGNRLLAYGNEYFKEGCIPEHSEGCLQLDLMLTDLRTREIIPIESGLSGLPQFAPNGKTLAYLSFKKTREEIDSIDLRLYNVETGNRQNITSGEMINESFAWSPDGETIAYASGINNVILTITDLSGKKRTVRLEGSMLHALSWSPDGTKIVLNIYDQISENFGLAIYDRDSGKVLNLPKNREIYQPHAFEWSPDSSKLVISGSTTENIPEGVPPESVYLSALFIYVLNLDRMDRITISNGVNVDTSSGPRFLLNGSRIVYTGQATLEEPRDLFTINPDGTDRKRLTNNGFNNYVPWLGK